jgi:hypothetical protein
MKLTNCAGRLPGAVVTGGVRRTSTRQPGIRRHDCRTVFAESFLYVH